MFSVRINDLNELGVYEDLQYDEPTETLKDIISRYNNTLNPKNTRLAIGNSAFQNWEYPIDACLFYGDSINVYHLRENAKRRNEVECDFGGNFADITNGGKEFQWNKNAPEWRIASKGFSLEGKCTNKDCRAYNNNVIINMGVPCLFKLGLPTDDQQTKCPLCEKHVKAVNCGFNNCEFRYKALVETDEGLEKKESDWKEIKDVYYTFDESKSLKYSSLVIEVKQGNQSITREFDCCICLNSSRKTF